MIKLPAIFISVIFYSSLFAQDSQSITEKVDGLTAQWDEEAKVLKTYNGMRDICKNYSHRMATVSLIKEIHHYDSLLYSTVKGKFDANKDPEAKATLNDIKKLEEEYTTKGFLDFIHKECNTFNTIENNFGRYGGKPYEKEKAKMEKELKKYVDEITQQIDIVDEHIHHLDGL